MKFSEICRPLGSYLFYFALIVTVPLLAALYFSWFTLFPEKFPYAMGIFFFSTIVFCLLTSAFFSFLGRKAKGALYRRESIVLVIAIWLTSSFFAALPFYFSGVLSPLDSFFEAMSGLTTTGSTMLISLKEVHPSLLFWRSLLQWLGGMGIVVLFLTLFPALGVGGKFLYQTEMSGPIKDAIRPRIKETASFLWKLYSGLTVLQIILLFGTNSKMTFFDALCLSLSTISTGGFTLHAESLAYYSNAATEWIVIVFMILGSISFALYFPLLHGKFRRLFLPDFFLFLFFLLLGAVLVSYFILGTPNHQLTYSTVEPYSLSEAIRAGTFQAISAQTTAGFFTANYVLWPFPAQMFMLLLMFIGGMSGSTSGGIKTSRFYIAYKILIHRLESIFRPNAVRKLMIHHVEIDAKGASMALAFICLALFFSVLGIVLFTLDGIDPSTSLGLMASFLNNVGIAFGNAGPMDSLSFLSPFSKVLSIFWMLLGRLEYFAVLLLFFPSFWRAR